MRADLRGRGVGGPFERASYERRGFMLAHCNVRCRTLGGGERAGDVVDVSAVSFGQLLTFDSTVWARARPVPAGPGSTDLSATRSRTCTTDDSPAAGAGPLPRGRQDRPAVRDDQEDAAALLTGLLAAARPAPEVFIDVPAANARAGALCAGRAMEPSFETARMYLGGRPPEDVQKSSGH